MNFKSKCLVTAGAGLAVAAGLVALQLAWPPDPGGGPSQLHSLGDKVTGTDGGVAGRTRTGRPDLDGKRGRVTLDKGANQPLDWSVEDLDDYVATLAETLSGRELARAMYNLFPYPEGGENQPNRLRAGSIPLDQQIRLYEKYLEPLDRQAVYAGIWALYRSSGALDEYRHGFLEHLPAAPFRASMFGEYFRFQYADYESLVEFLSSDDLATIRKSEMKADYRGATDAVRSLLRDSLESGAVSLAEIVDNLRSSVLDVESQNRIIVFLEKRAAEIEILLGEEEARGGNR